MCKATSVKIGPKLTDSDGADALPEEPEKGEIRFTVSAPLHTYLGWLVRNTVLGRTENDVARQILTQRLSEMRQEDFRDGQKL